MRLIAFRLLQKCRALSRSAARQNLEGVRASSGLDGVLRLLEAADGENAVAILRAEGAQVGAKTRVLRGLVIHNADPNLANLTIGESCHVGRQVFLDIANPVRIGNRVTISMRAMVITHTNVGDSRCGLAQKTAGVDIDDDAYIGAGATVLPGVRIGAAAIIGAGAVVTRNVAPAAVVVGVPGRPLTSP